MLRLLLSFCSSPYLRVIYLSIWKQGGLWNVGSFLWPDSFVPRSRNGITDHSWDPVFLFRSGMHELHRTSNNNVKIVDRNIASIFIEFSGLLQIVLVKIRLQPKSCFVFILEQQMIHGIVKRRTRFHFTLDCLVKWRENFDPNDSDPLTRLASKGSNPVGRLSPESSIVS